MTHDESLHQLKNPLDREPAECVTQSTRSDAPVLLTLSGGIATLTLNRPVKFNALSEAMLRALLAELQALAKDEDLRCVILTGAGPAFCAGHDLRELQAQGEEAYFRDVFALCGRVMQAIRAVPVPVIAKVRGIATAAGCQLVAACDLAIAADGARFAASGINLGLFCSTPAVALSRNIPVKAAFDLLFTGRFIAADQALSLGLVNALATEDGLDAAVAAYAAQIAAKSPAAVRLGKAMFYPQAAMPLDEAYLYAGDSMARNMMFEDARAGIAAFTAKR